MTCKHQSCKPCELEYLSCEDREDGLQYSPVQPLDHSKYITCDKGRTTDSGTCPYDAVWRVQSFPYNGTCVQLFAVPTDFNPFGQLPSCNGTVDGDYPFPSGYCPGYYKCEGGVATAVKCPNNTIFDTARKRCEVGDTSKCYSWLTVMWKEFPKAFMYQIANSMYMLATFQFYKKNI